MNMNEILAGLTGIEQKINGLDSDTRLKMREFADELMALKQRGVASINDNTLGSSPASPGRLIAQAITPEFENLRKTRQMSLQVKSFTGSAAVGVVNNMVGLTAPVGVYHGILQVLPMIPVAPGSSFRYARESIALSTGAAGAQAGEGGVKSGYQPGFTQIDQVPITVAAITKVSEQAMRNQAELTLIIEALIRRELALEIDRIALLGNTTPAWPGFIALATEDVSALWGERIDAIQECQVTMEMLGAMPAALMMAATDWLQTILAKTGLDDHYKVGTEKYMKDIDRQVGAMRVGLSSNVTVGKALLLDPMFAQILVSQDTNVQMAYSGDDFEKNLISIRVETEIVPVLRSTRGVRVSKPKP